jgi:hypothetical protein
VDKTNGNGKLQHNCSERTGPLDYAYFCGIGTAYNNSLSLQLGNVGAIQTGNIAIQMNTWSHVVGCEVWEYYEHIYKR